MQVTSMAAPLFTTLMAAAALLPMAAFAQSVTIRHAKGELTLETAPQKVAVFDLAALDTLDTLGVAAVAGVPKGEDGSFNAPAYLARYADPSIAGIGTLFEPDLAALKALAPDLIILAGRSAGKYDAVKDIAPTIDLTAAGAGLVADGIQNAETLGQIFRVEDKAAEKVAALTAAVAQMQAAAPAGDTAVVLFSVGETLMPHAPGARFGTLYDFVGLPSVMAPHVPPAEGTPRAKRPEPGSPEAEAAKQRQIAGRDAVLAEAPDWIITLDRGAISQPEPSDIAARLAKVATVTATPAWQAGQVIHLDPRAWYLVGSGLRNLTETAQTITAQFTAAQ